jgi:hydroxymethylpyrimidine/phosphomethylpyrimidine kinase
VLLKGGHLQGDPVDLLRHRSGVCAWRHRRVVDVNNHGSGCMLSAAIVACLALGDDLVRACERALAFVHDALQRSHHLGDGVRLAGLENARDDTSVLERLE